MVMLIDVRRPSLKVSDTILWVWVLNCIEADEGSWAGSMDAFISLCF